MFYYSTWTTKLIYHWHCCRSLSDGRWLFLSEQRPALPAGRNVFLRQNDLPPGGCLLWHGTQHWQVRQMRHCVQDKIHKNVSTGQHCCIRSCENISLVPKTAADWPSGVSCTFLPTSPWSLHQLSMRHTAFVSLHTPLPWPFFCVCTEYEIHNAYLPTHPTPTPLTLLFSLHWVWGTQCSSSYPPHPYSFNPSFESALSMRYQCSSPYPSHPHFFNPSFESALSMWFNSGVSL